MCTVVQIQPRKRALARADHTGPNRQHELIIQQQYRESMLPWKIYRPSSGKRWSICPVICETFPRLTLAMYDVAAAPIFFWASSLEKETSAPYLRKTWYRKKTTCRLNPVTELHRAIVIRTHDRPQKTYTALYLHTIIGPDYHVLGTQDIRLLVAVVNLCALANGGQLFFFLVRVLDDGDDVFFFFFFKPRSMGCCCCSEFERGPWFFWCRPNQKMASACNKTISWHGLK